MRCVALLLAVAALGVSVSEAAYFRLHDTNPLCFAEEIGYGSEIVVVEWTRRHASASRDIPVTVSVVSPASRKVVYSNHLKEAAGTFTFKPVAGEVGEYDVCFAASGIDSGSNRYVELSAAIDHHDRRNLLPHIDMSVTRAKPQGGSDQEVFTFTDYDGQQKETLRTHDYLTNLQFQLATALYEANEVLTETTWYLNRQKRMRQTSESTFDRVWMLSLLTVVVVIATSYVQFGYLKRYLRRKKLA
mmetsp:Transcript_31822/g.98479  ORF Transcript_31822/g.98479 Transcript_31822/m.98479 type:complete len:245 (-) Transcript_31822:31-765(-)|eukprot:CAMPEP_0174844378 /NCGR_PEP_ID=MMETSP1114-20130205/11065_1 /TAXON_ID=312471 /ORGANISM="Neobodo designis, Strain CCAP 1951/1" /LENGTH=244 /DNA_ID=CAMNT_0016078615 /DNA_START=40 /DNA_END=774 /DNA_ORIENTATION=+